MYGLAAALLLSACSQDEPTENSTALPEGEYPLQIGSVTLTAEVSEQPWTRVSENPADGMSSVWTHDDKIGVRIGDNEETGIYVVKLDAEGTVMEVVPEKPVYWKDKQPATITAWYPVKEELDFTHQNNGLTYLLKATGNGDYQSTPINLNFAHQLAKVRVKLEGTKADEVTAVTVRSYEGTNNEQGTPNGRIGTDVYVPMLKAIYGDETYWEANLLKGYLDADNTFRVSSDGKTYVQVNDYGKLRGLFGQLLAEIQRVKSTGDFAAARNLVENYGVKVDPVLHQEVLERYKKLNLAPYKGFVNPVYTAVTDVDGHITDVTVSYDEDYVEQMLRYSRDYATLPVRN